MFRNFDRRRGELWNLDLLCLGKLFWSFLTISNGLENNLENGLTLQILRWYKQLRFKDIVQEFKKLKKKWLQKQNKIKWFGGLKKVKKWLFI